MKTRKFDLDIYPLDFLRRAARDYSHIAKIVIIPAKRYAQCYFLACKVDELLALKEFSNYVIDLIGSKGHDDGNC